MESMGRGVLDPCVRRDDGCHAGGTCEYLTLQTVGQVTGQLLRARQHPTMARHLLDRLIIKQSRGARPLNPGEEHLPVRYYDWIAHFGRRTPDKLAVVDLASGRRLSYAQFDARISRLAMHLRDRLGIARGDRVAVLAMNTTDTLEVQFACGRLGAVFLPLNTRLTVPELQYIVGDAAPALMIHDAELADVALSVAKLCNVRSALLLGPDGPYEAAIAASRPLDKAEAVTLDDISTIMYTSGTTGQPKGAIITHGMTFWNCVNLGGPAYISPSSVLLTVLPLFHTGGLNCYTNPVLHAGGTVLIMRAFDPGAGAAIDQRSLAPHQRVLRRAVDLSVHGAASGVCDFRLQPPRHRRRRRGADAGAAA